MVRSRVKALIVCLVALGLVLGAGSTALAASWKDLDETALGPYGVSLDQLSQVSEGFPDGSWQPWNPVTRAQFAKMADKGFGIAPYTPATPSFSDVAADYPLFSYVEAAHAAGLMNGVAEGLFAPAAPLLREQAVAVVARQVAAREGFNLSSMTETEISAALAGFNDTGLISPSLRDEMAYAVEQGLVKGSKTGSLAPQAQMTRLAAATLIVRAAETGTLTLHKIDSGRTVSLEVGDVFQVVLKGNPTTGYGWSVALSDAGAAVLQEVGEPDYVADSDLIGAGGTYTFTFKAVAAGDAELKLVYSRPWESVPPLETFTLNVHVTTPPLDGTKWRLEGWSLSSLNPADFEITASFKDGAIGGKAAVNLYSGPYHAGPGSRFSIGTLMRTLMAGGDPEMRAEGAYFDLLGEVRAYKLDGRHLTLLDGTGNELLIFKPAS